MAWQVREAAFRVLQLQPSIDGLYLVSEQVQHLHLHHQKLASADLA
jgi:hypothetical protein